MSLPLLPSGKKPLPLMGSSASHFTALHPPSTFQGRTSVCASHKGAVPGARERPDLGLGVGAAQHSGAASSSPTAVRHAAAADVGHAVGAVLQAAAGEFLCACSRACCVTAPPAGEIKYLVAAPGPRRQRFSCPSTWKISWPPPQ